MKILSNFSKKGKLKVLLIAILVMILGGIGIFIANNGSNNILGINLPGIKGETVDSETAQAGSEKSTDLTSLQVVSAKEIANAEDKNDFYGKQVTNYTVDGIDVNWDVFYSDGTNIYLIADDYIERSKLPATKEGHKPNAGSSSYPRSAYFTNVIQDYKRF